MCVRKTRRKAAARTERGEGVVRLVSVVGGLGGQWRTVGREGTCVYNLLPLWVITWGIYRDGPTQIRHFNSAIYKWDQRV